MAGLAAAPSGIPGTPCSSSSGGPEGMAVARSNRTLVAVGVFVLLAGVVALGRWYESHHARPQPATNKQVLVHVTNAGDRGPGTLREALFIVAAATGPTTISIEVPKIDLETSLPALVNGHGVRMLGQASGAQIDAQALNSGAVLDISGPNT